MLEQEEKEDNDWKIKNYNTGPGMIQIVKVCTLTELEKQEISSKDVTTETGSTETEAIRSSNPTNNSVSSPSLQDIEKLATPNISSNLITKRKLCTRGLSTTMNTSTPKQSNTPILEYSSVNSKSPAHNGKNSNFSEKREKNVNEKQDKTNPPEIIEISPEQPEKQYKKQNYVISTRKKLENSSNLHLTTASSNPNVTVQTRIRTPPPPRKQLKQSYSSNSKRTTTTTKTTASSKSEVASSERPNRTAVSVIQKSSRIVPKSNTTKKLENSSDILSNSTSTQASSNSVTKVQKTNQSFSSHLKNTAPSSKRTTQAGMSATTTSLINVRKSSRVPSNSNTNLPNTRTSSPTNVSASTSINNERTVEMSTQENDNNNKIYCICNQGSFDAMVECDNKECPKKWFHFLCVGITSTPEGSWYCPECRKNVEQ